MSEIKTEYSSYKDPIAGVFYSDGKVYRYIGKDDFPFFEGVLANKTVKKLMTTGMLVNTAVIDEKDIPGVEGVFENKFYLQHDKIPFISYIYEWTLSMIKEAALFTLELQKKLIGENLSLKDATPYNVQFAGHKPVFIDFCSIEPISNNGVWFAHNQFMQMFAYPLLLRNYNDIDIKDIMLSRIEGISFEETYNQLGAKAKSKPGLIPHLLIPKLISKIGGSNRKELDAKAAERTQNLKNNQAVQTFMINRLIKLVKSIKVSKYSSHWNEYIQTKSYTDESEKFKQDFVSDFFKKENVSTVLDLGANTGEYSLIAEAAGCNVIAVDNDHDSVDNLFGQARAKNLKIMPLYVDIANPTPAIGWNNKERPDFIGRMKADGVFALALIHHLMVTNRQPLERIMDLFAELSNDFLIVEYIGRSDSMFKLLTKNRRESYDYFDEEYFKKVSSQRFTIVKEADIPGMDRKIFAMKKK